MLSGVGVSDSSYYWVLLVALPSLDVRVFAWYYCILLCRVQVTSLGSLLFSKGKREGMDLGGRGGGGGLPGVEASVRIYCMREK